MKESKKLSETSNGYIKKFLQQNSPINNELIRNSSLNDLDNSETKKQIEVIVRKKQKKKKRVTAMCSFFYDDNVNFNNLNPKSLYNISSFDRRVYNAIGTLWIYGKRTITLTEIFMVMNGYPNSNPSSKHLHAIDKSLTKLRSIRCHIDITEEVKTDLFHDKAVLVEAGILKNNQDEIMSVIIEDNLLHYKDISFTSKYGKVYKTIMILQEPCLLTYNRAKRTLIPIPIKYIGITTSNTTEKTIAFQDYLLMRIISYINGKLKENTIKYDTLYHDSGIECPILSKDFIRDREIIRKMLITWKEKGLISNFEEIKKGRSYVGVVFHVESMLEITNAYDDEKTDV